MNDTLTFLDCTLRDGGYYNNWDFDHDVVQRYITASARAGVDVLELGFRTLGADTFLGAYAHTTDELLRRLHIPGGLDVCVMVNASDLANTATSIDDGVDELFRPASESPVDVVRLAAHMHHVDRVPAMVGALADRGYRVGVNLMQVSRFDGADLVQAAKAVQSAGGTEVLYFADSFGDMTTQDIADRVEQVGTGWNGPIGLHAHDNRKLGLTNVLEAIDRGVTWIDGTIRGMGRGAGNAATEFILSEFRFREIAEYDVDALLGVVMGDFKRLHAEYEWGADLLYLKAAEHTVHPTYVQMMIKDDRYDLADVVAAIPALGRAKGHSYSNDKITSVLAEHGQHRQGSWDATHFVHDRDVLLLGAGPQLERHRDAVEAYIRDHSPYVICLNTSPHLDPDLIDLYAACHPTRMAMEAEHIRDLDRPLLAPSEMVESIGLNTSGLDLRDYGLEVQQGVLAADATTCTIPHRLTIAYALAAASRGGASRVLLAGLDGFAPGDERQEEMLEVIAAYGQDRSRPPLIALTPTSYPVGQSSVYAPDV